MPMVTLSLSEVEDLAFRALTSSNTSEVNARSVTDSVVAAEADGIHSHGLARLPNYCENAKCGKIDGQAQPTWCLVGPAAIKVDARDGFAHPAIDLGFNEFVPLIRKISVAALAVTNSYNCGVVGYHVERIADQGFIALAYVNAPASMAPWGGHEAVFGTNPIACAIPRRGAPPVIIDQASSVIAKSEIMVHAREGKAIPDGWALDAEGRSTIDPKAALDGGTMLPVGEHKGAGLALMVEAIAAGVTGSNFSFEASSFADNKGGAPRTGQFFIALDPDRFLGADFKDRIEMLFSRIISQQGSRLHGYARIDSRRRTKEEGVSISKSLHDRLLGYINA